MTTRATDGGPFAGVEIPDLDPLDMALNAAKSVAGAAAIQDHPDHDIRLQGSIFHVGAQGAAAAKVAAQMALVSIAADLRRIADHLAPHMGPE